MYNTAITTTDAPFDDGVSTFSLLNNAVRTAVIDDKPYFNLNDVMNAFEVKKPEYERSVLIARIAQTNAALEDFDGKGYQKNGTPLLGAADGLQKIVTSTEGGPQEMYYCNEPALYYLASRGKSNACLVFSHWIYSVVLPQLRKKGYYVSTAISPEQMQQLLGEIADLRARALSAEAKLDESTEKMSLVKYIALKHIDIKANYLSSTGRKIGKFVKELGREDEVETVMNQKYPCKCYPVDILERYFAENA